MNSKIKDGLFRIPESDVCANTAAPPTQKNADATSQNTSAAMETFDPNFITMLDSTSTAVNLFAQPSKERFSVSTTNDDLSVAVRDVLSRVNEYVQLPDGITMRLGEPDDICLISAFIDELAEFENASDVVTITPAKLLRNGWQSSRPYFYTIIVESMPPSSTSNSGSSGSGISRRRHGVGMAFFYAIHSTWFNKY